jgi:hypothetical protein
MCPCVSRYGIPTHGVCSFERDLEADVDLCISFLRRVRQVKNKMDVDSRAMRRAAPSKMLSVGRSAAILGLLKDSIDSIRVSVTFFGISLPGGSSSTNTIIDAGIFSVGIFTNKV